jgi:hypothetical protein
MRSKKQTKRHACVGDDRASQRVVPRAVMTKAQIRETAQDQCTFAIDGQKPENMAQAIKLRADEIANSNPARCPFGEAWTKRERRAIAATMSDLVQHYELSDLDHAHGSKLRRCVGRCAGFSLKHRTLCVGRSTSN